MLKSKKINMIEGDILSSVIRYSIPIVLAGMLQVFFNAADLAVVGWFADSGIASAAQAAVGATTPIINLIIKTVVGMSVGVNVVLARSIGARDRELSQRIVHTAITLSALIGIVLVVFGMFISRPIMVATDCTPESLEMSVSYLKIYFAGAPAILLYNYASAILRTKGDTKRPLRFLTISGVLNVFLNVIFVVIFRINAAGVGLATTITQYLSAFLTLRCLIIDKDDTHLDIRKIGLHRSEIWAIVKYGLPSGITYAMFSVSTMMIQSTINTYGASVVAGNSAAISLEGLIEAGLSAFNAATVAFMGQNIGAKQKERVKKSFGVCLAVTVVFCLVLCYGLFAFGAELVRWIYCPHDMKGVETAVLRMKYLLMTYVLIGLKNIFEGALQAFGYSALAMINSIIVICGFRIAWMKLIYVKYETLDSLYLCFPISLAVLLAADVVCFIIAYRKYKLGGTIR